MRILWLCNIMLPAVAKQLGVEASNKEGWRRNSFGRGEKRGKGCPEILWIL